MPDVALRRRWPVLLVATVAFATLLAWALGALDPRGVAFAFVAVWLPMTWLGTVSHVAPFQLSERFHALRACEVSGRLYELLGVRLVKRLLRRGPMALFNPGLRLPPTRTAEGLERLERSMRTAEASHFIMFVATVGIVAHAAVRGWWLAAGATALFDLFVNGYPVVLQRYNRALLRRRFGELSTPPDAPAHVSGGAPSR